MGLYRAHPQVAKRVAKWARAGHQVVGRAQRHEW